MSDLVDRSKAALALLEIGKGKGCTIEGQGIIESFCLLSYQSLPPRPSLFDTKSSDRELVHLAFESARPQDIVSKALFHKFRHDRLLLKRCLTISLMVISYLDDTWERIIKSDAGKSIYIAFINHLSYWHLHVNAPNVIKCIKSYLCEELIILSSCNVTISEASRDAKHLIAKLIKIVKNEMRESLTIVEFLDYGFQQLLNAMMRIAFNKGSENNGHVFMTIINQITSLVISKFSTLAQRCMDEHNLRTSEGNACSLPSINAPHPP
jgi:hypothetical protein